MRFSRFATFIFMLAAFAAGCAKEPSSGNSTISMKIPALSELNAKSSGSAKDVMAQSISIADRDWSKACFMVNVTGPGIPDAPNRPVCKLPSGIFAGSVGPGGELKISVPKGNDRKFEVFAYFRSSVNGPCVPQKSINDFDFSSTARMGTAVASISKDVETVDINLSLAAASQTVYSQYSLPPLCDSSSGKTVMAATSGSTIHAVSSNGSILRARIAAPSSELPVLVSSPGSYSLRRRGH